MPKPPRTPRPERAWRDWINVTISLEPCDAALLKVIKARYKVKSTSHALRMLLRDSCGMLNTEEDENEGDDEAVGPD